MNSALLVCLAVLGTQPEPPANFDTEIMPVLTKAGCNSGACHGAAAGRGGFHLSLLGSDPGRDYDAIVHALEGRRVNLSKPELSLILAKPTARLEHGGDSALPEGEAGEQRLLAWIKAGAPRGDARKLTSFEIAPPHINCDSLPAEVQVQARARFDDGPPEVVTRWTLLSASDKDAVVINHESAKIEIRRRGQHIIIARFLNRVVPIQINVPFSDNSPDLADEAGASFIDAEILRALSVLNLPVSPQADDSTFLRRVRLDLTGRLPSREEIEQFLGDDHSTKRTRKVDDLLASDDFVDYWTLRFARHLNVHGLPNESEGVRAYTEWLHRAIQEGMPLNVMARQLITATGDAHVIGPANFGRMVGDARAHAELVGRFFLGVRLGCANCHNHPLDKWTQDDYHGLAAVFARFERGRTVQLAPRGSVTNLRTGEPAIPRIPGERDLDPEEDHLLNVAEWLTGSQQQYFARATVNRLWHAMFGRGLVEPIDDLRDTNPATHPKLLSLLAQDFVDHNFNLRHTLRTIALTNAYGRSEGREQLNEMDDRFYSRMYRRPLMPEVLADAISDVTGVAEVFDGLPSGTRAVKVVDPLSRAPGLDNLGRCAPGGTCAEISGTAVGVATQLHLINGDLINRKLSSPSGHLQQMIARRRSNTEIVEEFFLRALSRHPTTAEQADWCRRLEADSEPERHKRLEDFVWSLLNSRQFMENH